MKLLRLLLFAPLLFLSLSALSQTTDTIYVYPTGRYPNLFTEETNPDSSNFELYSQKDYAPRRANLWNLKRYFDQALTFSGDTLYLSGADTTYSIFIGDYTQSLTLSNDTLTISDGNYVVLEDLIDNFTASTGIQRVADDFRLNIVGLDNLADAVASNDSLVIWDASSDSHVRIDITKLATAIDDVLDLSTTSTIYSANDTLSGDRTVTGDSNDLNFDGIDSLSIDTRAFNIVASETIVLQGDYTSLVSADSITIQTPDHLTKPVGAFLQKKDQLTSRVEWSDYYFPTSTPGSGIKVLQWDDGLPTFVVPSATAGQDSLYKADDTTVVFRNANASRLDTIIVGGTGLDSSIYNLLPLYNVVVNTNNNTLTFQTDTTSQNEFTLNITSSNQSSDSDQWFRAIRLEEPSDTFAIYADDGNWVLASDASIIITTPNLILPSGSISSDELATDAVNLGYTASPTNGIVTNDHGDDSTLPLADGTNAGLLAPADFTKLSNHPTSPYWTLSGSNIYRNSNVGVGVDPSTIARFVTRGSGATASTITGLFEKSDGTDILTINDGGFVIVNQVSATGGLQIGTNNNFNMDLSFGGQGAGSNGLIRGNSGNLSFGTWGNTTAAFLRTGTVHNFTVGGQSSAFNGFIRGQGLSGNVQIPAAGFSAFSTGGTFQYVNATSTNTIAQYQANSAWTQVTGSGTGYNVGFIFNPSYSLTSADTTNFKLKLGAYLSEPTITLSPTTTVPFFHYKSVSDNLSLGTRPIYDFWSNTNSGNNSYGFRAEGTALNWLRGNTAIGETSTTTSGTNLEVYGRTATQQLIGRGTEPTATIQAAAGTGATASIVSARSSDLAGIINGTTGTGSVVAGNWVRVDFVTAYSNAPVVVLEADGTDDSTAGDNAAGLRLFWSTIVDTTGFYIRIAGDPSALTEIDFQISYHVIGK